MNRNILTFLLIALGFTVSAQSKQVKKLYSKKKYKQAIALAKSELSSQGEHSGLQLILGRAYADYYEFEKAISLLKKVENSATADKETKAMAKAYIGKCYFAQGDQEQGIAILKECAQGKESRAASKFASKELLLTQTESFYKNWTMKESQHIRFHFQDESILEDVDAFMNKQELIAQRMFDFFKLDFGKKVDFFVWKNEMDAYRYLGESLALSYPDFAIVNTHYKKIREYELCHMICRRVAKPEQRSMLISEGLGVYFEQMDKNLFKEARNAIPKDHFFVTELWEQPTKYAKGLSYPVGAALIEHLVNTGGKKKLIQLLHKQSIEHGMEVYSDFDRKLTTFNALLLK
eukprot:TRINITY_DN1107_c0_g4_i1.p1 TRINITY_DN1107_c0_g4~~TRINITY_DN1107_c0_g4_i1.p1  ORF type:complete len:348 (+),score=-8.41 TRINITY_DN1107_c0_g4_i1:649-1692(+)